MNPLEIEKRNSSPRRALIDLDLKTYTSKTLLHA
jgi:hypothetical protein